MYVKSKMAIPHFRWLSFISVVVLAFFCSKVFDYFVDVESGGIAHRFDMAETEIIGKNKIKSAVTGEEVTVESLWANQPVVIVFFRRWGCVFCRVAARQISTIKEDLDANNVRLVGIGVEDLGKEDFIKGEYFKGDLFVDEEKKCYKDLKYKRYGMLSILPALITQTSRNVYYMSRSEKIEGDLQGDKYQVGGTLVVSAGGEKVLLSHRQESLADHIDPNEILKSLGLPPKDIKFHDEKAECSVDEKSACQ